jgi:hypothetical protein
LYRIAEILDSNPCQSPATPSFFFFANSPGTHIRRAARLDDVHIRWGTLSEHQTNKSLTNRIYMNANMAATSLGILVSVLKKEAQLM